MVATSLDQQIWMLKARALLLPTPFSAIDPDGEEERATGTLERFGQLGVEPDAGTDHDTLLDLCARDAYDAHALVPWEGADDEPPRRSSRYGMVHPLDAGETQHELTPEQIPDLHQSLLNSLPARDSNQWSEWYRQLWWACQSWYSDLGVPLPGSFTFPDHTAWAHRNMAAALAGARAGGNQAALLYLHVGPVQGFIKASRRTHDLWVSSFTVAFLAFHAAQAVADAEGPDALVYPDLGSLPLSRYFLKEQGKSCSVDPAELVRPCLPNRFAAIIARERAEAIVTAACESVCSCFKNMATAVREALGPAEQALRKTYGYGDDFWRLHDPQIDDLVELDAVVQPWPKDRDGLQSFLQRLDPRQAEKLRQDLPEDRTGDGYGQLFNLTHRLLGAHRSTVFAQPLKGEPRAKCGQCGEREQLGPTLKNQRELAQLWTRLSEEIQRRQGGGGNGRQRLSLQIKEGEGLCAICLTKRFAPEHYFGNQEVIGLQWGRSSNEENHRHLLRYPSVASVASAPWRWLLGQQAHLPVVRQWLSKVGEAEQCLDWDPPRNELPGLGRLGATESWLAHDGIWFYPRAYEPDRIWRDHYGQQLPPDIQIQDLGKKLADARTWFRQVVRRLEAEPTTYLAVLVMDGDRMGNWLTGKSSPRVKEVYRGDRKLDDGWLSERWANQPRPLFPALHSELSRRLGRMAVTVIPEIVEHQYLGRLVYSGGDDVLALLPLQTVLPCARALAKAFSRQENLGSRVTVSAGIAVWHMMEPLSRAIEEAHRAEAEAKESGRKRFCLQVNKRSGAPLSLSLPWQLDAPGGQELDTVEELLGLLKPLAAGEREEDRQPLKNPNLAYRLEQEVALLDPGPDQDRGSHQDRFLNSDEEPEADRRLSPAVRAAFASRLRTLLGRRHSLLEAVLTGEHPMRPQEVVDLLMVARFLLREERGIATGELLDELARKEVRP
jgi:CRISPR-associated protein Cmr2